MLCMLGDAGSVGLLWRRTDSGGICRVVYVRAYGVRENAVEEGDVRWYPSGCVCPGIRNLTWRSHAGKENRERAGLPSVRGSAIHVITSHRPVRMGDQSTASKACFKSAMISSAFSRPQLRRTRSMPTPASLSCCSVS